MATSIQSDRPRASGIDRKAAILEQWPDLTLEDVEIAGDDGELLAVRIVERYGISWDWARRNVAAWEAWVGDAVDTARRAARPAATDGRRGTVLSYPDGNVLPASRRSGSSA